MSQRRIATIDTTIILATVALIVAHGVAWWAPWKPALVVWSCGGNYESLSDYTRAFEREHHCRVRYTAAPVQYLLELAASRDASADVLVGRSGPGWIALRQRDKLARGPVLFAVDPFVIITPAGNPASIRDLKDLGRPGVRTAYAPFAMRPRGKCPSHLMAMADAKFDPGLAERWLNNMTAYMKCGRKLCDPILDGRADAAIVPRSTTSWPELQGKVEFVPIGPKYHDAMKSCRAVPPQSAGVLAGGRNPQLANAFVDGLVSEEGQRIFAAHGYLPIESPEAQQYEALLEVFTPKDMPGWQFHLAQMLYDDAAYGAALRRCFVLFNVFGTSHADARALYLAGECARELGKPDVARMLWERLIRDFPHRRRVEWLSTVLHVGKPVPGVERLPEQHFVRLAQEALHDLPDKISLSQTHRRWLQAFPAEDIRILEADPTKCGKRWFATAEMSLAAGEYVAATREYLKILTLNYPSSYMPAARFRVALCDYLRGKPGTARHQWETLAAELPDDQWGQAAATALDMSSGQDDPVERRSDWHVESPPWELSYDTYQQRGMSYGMMLAGHDLPLYAFKEMMKISHGVYGKPGKLAAQARYRAGLFCKKMGSQTAAGMQWMMCQAYWPESKWGKLATTALERLAVPGNQNSAERPRLRVLLSGPAPLQLKPAKTSPHKRFNIAEEFYRAGLFADDQCLLEYMKVLTVTDPSGKKNAPFMAEAEFKVGMCLLKTNRPEPARRHFNRVLALYPDSPEAARAQEILDQGAM